MKIFYLALFFYLVFGAVFLGSANIIDESEDEPEDHEGDDMFGAAFDTQEQLNYTAMKEAGTESFKKMDKDNDGKVTKSEALKELPEWFTKSEFNNWFKENDLNNDGFITLEELYGSLDRAEQEHLRVERILQRYRDEGRLENPLLKQSSENLESHDKDSVEKSQENVHAGKNRREEL
eukprot:TRINITY_DN979_c0_g2_i4.p1 TRINITY_DN979_c0_g2~~TRINITY_DN979_c0_g2_i4.p1  ORF type:complete len:178 (-),score=58.68 TRINITY_DN979_c0_g2_i4:63-596(-)